MHRSIVTAIFLLCVVTSVSAYDVDKAAPSQPEGGLKPRITPSKPFLTKITGNEKSHVITVKFREGTQIRLRGGKLISLNQIQLASLDTLLNAYPQLKIKPLFTRPEQDLDRDKAEGEKNSKRELADLNLYFTFELPKTATKETVEQLINSLNALEIVELAYPEPIPVPAAADVPPATPNFEPGQGYLNPAPQGIDARYAWSFPGGQGENVKFIDMEFGWRITHEDLKPPFFSSTNPSASVSDIEHGTAVLGEIVGDPNGFGITGIAPQAAYGVVTVLAPNYTPANAINVASSALAAGDALLLELQWGTSPPPGVTCSCNQSQCGNTPMEYFQAEFDAIKAATASGRIVIEPAGNGSVNLDDPYYGNLFKRHIRDSGAIMVGASTSNTAEPMCFTNYGSRLDVRAWGENVTTTGYGYLFNGGGDPNQYYTNSFSGTSSAGPIVTGAALAIQGYKKAQTGGNVLTPTQMRDILIQTGTPQAASSKHIGPLPNLRAALPQVDMLSTAAIIPIINFLLD